MKDLKETLEELRNANDEWRGTFDAMDEAVALLDAEGMVLRCNRAMAEFAKKPFSRIIGHDCQEICICIGGNRDQCPMVRCRTSLKRESAVFNHTEQWFEVSVDPILDKAGRLQGAVHILRDITERKQMEAKLKLAVAQTEDEKAKTESIIDSIGDGISIQDREFRVLYQNPAQRRLIGDHVGEFCYRAYEKRDAQCDGCGIAQVFKDGNTHIVQRTAPTDKGVVHVEITASPLRDSQGNIIAGIDVVHNITERKKAEETLRNNQVQLAESQRIAGIGSWERNLSTNQVMWSVELFRIFGLDPEKVQADFGTLLNLIHPDDRERQRLAVTEAIQLMHPYDTDYRILKPDGSQAVIHAQGEVVCDEAGNPVLLRGTAQDITERKRVEDEIKQQKAFTDSLIQNSAVATFVLDTEHNVLIWNKACEELTGSSKAEMIGTKDQWKPFYDHERPVMADLVLDGISEDLGPLYSSISQSLHAPDGLHAEGWYDLNGKDCYLVFDAAPIRDGRGAVIAAIETLQDITDHKRLEMAIRESEERYRTVVENAFDMIHSIAPDGRFLYANPAWLRTMGYTWEELSNKTIFEIIHPNCQSKCSSVFSRLSSGSSIEHFETQFSAKDGRVIDVEGSASVILVDGRVKSMQCLLHDVTERKRLGEELYRSQQDWENTFDSITDMVTVHDRDFNIILANKAAEKILGLPLLEKMKDRKCFSYYHGTDDAPYGCPSCGCLQSGEPALFEMFEPHLNMFVEIRAIPRFDSSGNLIGLIHIVRDITERKKSESEQERLTREKEHLREQLLQSQKMEAVGTLAGGIAHDFNNILNVIIGYGGLLETIPGMTEKAKEFLSEIIRAADRAAYLTRGLLAFSRKQHLELKPANLNDIIRSIMAMLHRIIGEDITMNIVLSEDNMIIICDAGQVEQIVVNLATNARDAMPRGGLLKLETETVEMDEEFIALKGFGNPGKHAVIRLTDTGSGMDAKTLERIFEPFFTTKEVGKGTGLGLSIIYGIVKQHNGFLECESRPGQGTVFSVYLPFAVMAESADEGKKTRESVAKGRGELILIGEDDESGRRLLKVVLEHQGYRVIEAVNGIEVIEKFREHSAEIALMLLDVIMPDMNGCDALEMIQQQFPDTKAILMSGYTADILEQKGIKEVSVPLLKKPISPHELLQVVRSIIDGKE